MTRVEWGADVPWVDGGVDHGVLYLDGVVVPWNGLVRVEERDDVELEVLHFDGRPTRVHHTLGTFSATLEAFYYPPEFEPYAGVELYLGQQKRRPFGLAWRVGYDGDYEIHLVWNALVRPVVRSYKTWTRSIVADTFLWNLEAKASGAPGLSPAAHVVIPRRDFVDDTLWGELDTILFGSESVQPQLPSLAELIDIFAEYDENLQVVQNLDGTWTASGPAVTDNGDGTYEISSSTAGPAGPSTHSFSSE